MWGVHSVQGVVGAAVYIVDNSYVLWVHLVDNLLWVRMYCGYVLWVHAPTLWVRVCIVGAYMLWGTPTHNIYVLHPQYIVRVYILWVNIVGDFSFTDAEVRINQIEALNHAERQAFKTTLDYRVRETVPLGPYPCKFSSVG